MRLDCVGYWQGIALHERDRLHRNEALNTLLEFGHFFLRLDSFANPDPADDSLNMIVEEVSFDVAPGSVVAVIDAGGAARMALTRMAGGALRPLRGTVRWRGRTACFSQFMAAPLSHRSISENLLNLCRIIAAPKERSAAAVERLRTDSDHGRFLDMPLRRVPRHVFTDLGVHLLCLLDFDCVAADEAMRPRSDRTQEVWWDYVRATPGSRRVVFLSGRRLEPVLEQATHLALVDGGRLLFYGPAAEAKQRFGDFIETAVSTPFTADDFAVPVEDFEDDDGDGEDDGAFGYEPDRRDERNPRDFREEEAPTSVRPPEPVRKGLPLPEPERGSALCRLEPLNPGAGYLYRAGTLDPVEVPRRARLPRRWRAIPIVAREEAFDVVFALESLVDEVAVKPAVALSLYDSPTLRLESEGWTCLRGGERHVVRLTVPANLLEPWDYEVTPMALVSTGEGAAGIVDLPKAARFAVLADGSTTQIRNAGAAGKSKVVLRTYGRASATAAGGNFLKIVEVECLDGRGQPYARLESDQFEGPSGEKEGLQLAITLIAGGPGRVVGHVDLSAQTFGVLRCELEEGVEISSGQQRLLWALPDSFRYAAGYRLTVTLQLHGSVEADGIAEARAICHFGPEVGRRADAPTATVEVTAACRVDDTGPSGEDEVLERATVAGPRR